MQRKDGGTARFETLQNAQCFLKEDASHGWGQIFLRSVRSLMQGTMGTFPSELGGCARADEARLVLIQFGFEFQNP